MACCIAPTAEAIVTTIVKKNIDKRAKHENVEIRNPFIKRMNWRNNTLWGGRALVSFEHVWHGEVVPWYPFLTNALTSADAAEMLKEIATSGVAMAALVTAVWAGIVALTHSFEKKADVKAVRR